jgi:Flp pilus assembly protein TadD
LHGGRRDAASRIWGARARYEKPLAIDPFHARALNNLGVWLDRHGKGGEAIRTLERAIQADPDNAEAYSNLGTVHRRPAVARRA